MKDDVISIKLARLIFRSALPVELSLYRYNHSCTFTKSLPVKQRTLSYRSSVDSRTSTLIHQRLHVVFFVDCHFTFHANHLILLNALNSNYYFFIFLTKSQHLPIKCWTSLENSSTQDFCWIYAHYSTFLLHLKSALMKGVYGGTDLLPNAECTSAKCASTISPILGVNSFPYIWTTKMAYRRGACQVHSESQA